MGDHHVQFPSGLHLNGLLPDEVESVTRVLDAERWALAERRTAELIATIQPNPPSEQRRNAVANYVQRLITKCFSCQVCTFGSVPLKTYLPDGDIDLTAVTSNTNLKDTWASELRNILENEERSENAEFRVKEVQYIQAEVKIVKCLVENIVVDISLNQVGGLCTLCFLEEIDHLINQNHLFKRSIILIKAWCYYESRILGAHHGLISTYALETLVLYIFHVFNNSFAGPLEVLYRFLEFFSNFDWENFCISLWGPVPISSLPDMTAEPPRKDGGKLLLEKPFLDACTTVYAVPGGQENQGQPFVSKHFNVIDPLRTNNNLGRSVSKGNFFRIRSAFGFGAKKLARLLECPKESLIDEVNLFFMNTWERHGSGHRPDAPNSNLWHLQPLESLSVEESNTSRMAAHIPQVINIINQHSQSAYKTSNPSNISRAHSQRSYGSRSSDQPDKSQKTLKPDHSISVQFARTQSSPELTDSSRRSSALESGRPQYSHARSDFYGGSRRKNLSSEVSGHGAKSSFDELSSISHSSSHQSLEGSTNHDDIAFQSMREELPSVSEALEIQQDMQQEEQDLVNMMATRLHTFNGQLQLPMHLASHLPLPLSPVLASMGYGQRNLTGMVPSNIALIDSSWGHGGIQFPQGFASPSLSPYFPSSASLSSNVEESIEPGNETSEESIHGLWHEHDSGSSRGFNSDNGVPDLHSDDNGGFSNFVPSSRGSSPSVSYIQGQQKRENHMEALPNSRFVPVSQASSSRSKSFSESSKDWSSQRGSKSSRDKWGRKPPFVSVVTSMHGRSNSSGHISPQEDDDSKDWVPISTMSTDIVDRNPGPDSMILSSPVIVGNSHQRMDNSGVVPVAFYPTGPPVPFLTMLPIPLCNYQPDAGTPASSSSHFHEDEGEDDNCIRELDQNFDSAENLEQSEAHMSFAASTSRSGASESSNEPKTDILHSDFASHWQNLQLGRFCQTSSNHGPFMYSSPMMVPPTYLHGHVPWEGPGRPNLNMFTQIAGYGPRLIPVQPLQSGPNRPATVFQQYGDEPPRFRSGTGTYLPNPKVPFRDRQFPSTRNHRGNYNYDRGDHGDREGSWISTKARAASRIHGRNQSEKPSARIDRYAPTDKRSDKPWDSYRQENNTSHQSRGNSFGPSNSAHGSADMPYGVYQMPSASSNGVGPSGPGVPSVVMLYPYDQGVSYSSSSESLEFGTLGSMQLPDASEVPHSSEGNLGRVHEQRHGTYSARSSPDQPSSLHTQRGC